MLGDQLSLAASSLASEGREVVCDPVWQYQPNHGRTRATGTSPPGSLSTETSQNSSRGGYQTGGRSQFSHLAMGEEDPSVE